MTDTALTSKTVSVSLSIKETQGANSTLDTIFLDDRTVHRSQRFLFDLAADSITSIDITAPPGKTTYPKWLLVQSDQDLQYGFSATEASTANPSYGVKIKGNAFGLNCVANTSVNTFYVHNLSTAATATVTVVLHQVTWTV